MMAARADKQGLDGFIQLAVGLGGLALFWLIISLIFGAYDSIHLPRVSDALFWGGYATYTAVALFEITLLDKFSVIESPRNWLYAILAGIAFVVVPLILLARSGAVPSVNSNFLPDTVSCGSWLSPSSFSQTSFTGSTNPCTSQLDTASRYALTIGVVGFAWPLVAMVLQVYGRDLKTDKS
jgi:hypothetical protein